MSDTPLYHVKLCKADLNGAKYAIVPGDPGRCEGLAKMLDPNPKFLAAHREYTSYLANFHGVPVLVCSTGMGGPSVTIGMEELAELGIEHFLRIGTCGAIQPHLKLGDLIITKAAIRLDGASDHYAPIEFPAVASMDFTWSLITAARELNVVHYTGITASTATFYPGQERYNGFNKYVLRRFQGSMEEWKHLNVLNYEMEAATLFTVASVFGLKAACMCGVVGLRKETEVLDLSQKEKMEKNWHDVMIRGLEHYMKFKGSIQ